MFITLHKKQMVKVKAATFKYVVFFLILSIEFRVYRKCIIYILNTCN